MTQPLHEWWSDNQITDVLETLAQLPNDEVLTPPRVARATLDLLPQEVWLDPTLKWCDPFSKSGVFLREVYRRLMQSLMDWQPDDLVRRTHILKEMIFGCGITELTSQVVRRTLYQSFDATGSEIVDPEAKKLLVPFDDKSGNVWYERGEHVFQKGKKTCQLCGGSKKVIENDRENFAYPFLHNERPFGGKDMKFDIILGNPPYQIGMKDENGERTKNITPLYDKFVEKAIELKPKYILMITPSRWFTAGKNLDSFRTKMLNDRRIRNIVDYPNGREIFPTVDVKGGISYFLWDRDFDGDCEFQLVVDGQKSEVYERDLREGDGVLVRDMKAMEIVKKVKASPHFQKSLATLVSKRDPFGGSLTTNFGFSKDGPFDNSVPLIFGNRIGYISQSQIQSHSEWIDKYKVLIPMASDGRGSNEDMHVLGEPIAVAPGSVCTQTYLVAGSFENKEMTVNYAQYLTTKFVRFLVFQRKTSQHVIPDRFLFAPMLDMTRNWSDENLYELFDLSADEIAYIEKTVTHRGWIDSSDSAVPKSHLPGGEKYKKPMNDVEEVDDS